MGDKNKNVIEYSNRYWRNLACNYENKINLGAEWGKRFFEGAWG